MADDTRVTYELVMGRRWEARFLSHLDVMRAISRALRRTGLPIYYSEGFNPKPKVSYLTPPLSVGHTSECERVRFLLMESIETEKVTAAFKESLPPGISLEKLSGPLAPNEPKKTESAIECFALLLDPAGKESIKVNGSLSEDGGDVIRNGGAMHKVPSFVHDAITVKMISLQDALGLSILSDPAENRRFLEKHFVAGAMFTIGTGANFSRPDDVVKDIPLFAEAKTPFCFHRK